MRIVIIGAGVAGCVLARQLAQLDGAEVICLERVAHGDHAEAGTGLNIGPNAVKALHAVDPDLAAQITAAALPWANWRICLADGTLLFDLPLREVADHQGWRIRWSELYHVLRDAAGAVVAYGCDGIEIERAASDPRRSAVSWQQGGRPCRLDEVDLVIAADGRYSEVRRSVSGPPPQRLVGVAISRTLVPDTSDGLIDDYAQWFNGPNRLLAFRVPPDHVYIASAFPIAPEAPIDDALKTPAALRAAFTPQAGAPCAAVGWMVKRLSETISGTHWARMQEHDPLYRAADRNVLYLGDAAHGMVPTLGQGATQAIEDAATAASLIAQRWHGGDRDVRQWLDAIAATRMERIRFVMAFSLAATDTMLAGADPVAGTLQKNEPPFRRRLQRLYRDIGWPQPSHLERGEIA
ncbi:FAD-dependent oxidoreductase [Bradyrhizobium sp. HKCCYLS2038]|uniref:FAD-dependent oxidoreductase n=1 Tax=unclassified Bradyrhizobium TaxID=2631580 RepID=UPI003EC01478